MSGDNLNAKDQFVFYIETINALGPCAFVEGWAFHQHRDIHKLYLMTRTSTSENHTQLHIGKIRTDVFNAHGAQSAKKAGFFGRGIMLFGPTEISLRAEFVGGGAIERYVGLAQFDKAGKVLVRGDMTLEDASSWNLKSLFETQFYRPYYALSALVGFAARPLPTPPATVRATTIITSVFKGREYLDDFFGSFEENTSNYSEFIIVDNGNEDRNLINYLKKVASGIPHARIVRVDDNQGYVEGIIFGYDHREYNGHVVVLNTDIVLPPNWLERLLWPLENMPKTATASPYTNAGTICSFPYTDVDNPIFRGQSVNDIDEVFQRCDPGKLTINIPSGVGFCMAMHGELIDRIGFFETKTFGFGYGEENDWSLKASSRGWANVLVPNLFVYHKHGGVYPSEQKQSLIERNLGVINHRYPAFDETVRRAFAQDPNAALREIIAFLIATRFERVLIHTFDERNISDIETVLEGSLPSICFIRHSEHGTWLAIMSSRGEKWAVWGVGTAERHALERAVVRTEVGNTQ